MSVGEKLASVTDEVKFHSSASSTAAPSQVRIMVVRCHAASSAQSFDQCKSSRWRFRCISLVCRKYVCTVMFSPCFNKCYGLNQQQTTKVSTWTLDEVSALASVAEFHRGPTTKPTVADYHTESIVTNHNTIEKRVIWLHWISTDETPKWDFVILQFVVHRFVELLCLSSLLWMLRNSWNTWPEYSCKLSESCARICLYHRLQFSVINSRWTSATFIIIFKVELTS